MGKKQTFTHLDEAIPILVKHVFLPRPSLALVKSLVGVIKLGLQSLAPAFRPSRLHVLPGFVFLINEHHRCSVRVTGLHVNEANPCPPKPPFKSVSFISTANPRSPSSAQVSLISSLCRCPSPPSGLGGQISSLSPMVSAWVGLTG